MSAPQRIKISGKVYIKYINETEYPKIGDIILYLNDDATATIKGNYESLKCKGYIKAKIFDSKYWHHVDIAAFCTNQEHHFSKGQKSINNAYLCSEIISRYAGKEVERSYRCHYIYNE